jgi:hypothetical protein
MQSIPGYRGHRRGAHHCLAKSTMYLNLIESQRPKDPLPTVAPDAE